MKPYGRKGSVNFPGKRDCHPRKGYINWWEDICDYVSRRFMKQKMSKDIDELLNEALLDTKMDVADEEQFEKDVKEMNEHIEDYLPYVEE